jgi:AhpD family alkylhydroperoxidase
MYDMKNLSKMKNLEIHAPEAMKAFVAFDKAALAEGAIPAKYKELIALAVAFTTQCPYCIELHSNKAREKGASDPEIAESVLVAAALRAGGAITHGTHAMKGTRQEFSTGQSRGIVYDYFPHYRCWETRNRCIELHHHRSASVWHADHRGRSPLAWWCERKEARPDRNSPHNYKDRPGERMREINGPTHPWAPTRGPLAHRYTRLQLFGPTQISSSSF